MGFTKSHTQWAKLGKIDKVSFIGKDVVCFGHGCHLLFMNLTTKEEHIYTANCRETGDGVSCFMGNRSIPVFAFAESCSTPRIFVKAYQNFEHIHEFSDGALLSYIALAFSNTSMLVSLSDIPHCNLIVWNWRSGDKLKVMDPAFVEVNQILKASLGYPLHICQVVVGTNKMVIWDILRSLKRIIVIPHRVHLPNLNKLITLSSVAWTSEGTVFIIDQIGNIYTVSPHHMMEKVIEFDEPGDLKTSMTWVRGGLAVAGPNNELRLYKKVGQWEIAWKFTPFVPLNFITSNTRDTLIAVSVEGDVLVLNATNDGFDYVKTNESRFDDFCFIYPTGNYVVTLARQRQLTTWEKVTRDLEGKALAIAQNPEYPYIGVGYESGILELFSIYNPDRIESMVTFQLTKNQINSIYFTEIPKLFVAADVNIGQFFVIEGSPGTRMQVVGTVDINHQIADYILIPSRTCYRLFCVFVTTDLYLAGNKLMRYCIIKDRHDPQGKQYELEDPKLHFRRLYASTKENRDRVFYAMPFRSKSLLEIETKRAEPIAKTVNEIRMGHQMGKILFSFCKNAILSYAYDGLIMIRDKNFNVQHIIMPHHRSAEGVLKAVICPVNKYVVSLGRDNNLICSVFDTNYDDTERRQELQKLLESEIMAMMFKRRTKGFLLKGELDGKTWFEVEEMRHAEAERKQCEADRKKLLKEFDSIQNEITNLLTENLEGPENEKLAIQDFNLDEDYAQELKEISAAKCKQTRLYLEALIEAQDKISTWAREYFWDRIEVQGECIRAIFDSTYVNSYIILPEEGKRQEMLKQIAEWRKLEDLMSKTDSFQPWLPILESELTELLERSPSIAKQDTDVGIGDLDDDELEEVEKDDIEVSIAKLGSAACKFIEMNSLRYTQEEVQSYLQTHIENIMSDNDVLKLKLFFNKKYEATKSQKEREMVNLRERYQRLRHIISEINFFATVPLVITLDEPEWEQDEFPEKIMKVEDNEVGVLPYVSPSEQAILDWKAAEAERIRLLLLADDFRERALMKMMNGVLEVKWEDELKKDAPIPKCMLDKDPANYTEEDLRVVKEYETAVKFLHSERERYMNMLYSEYAKIRNSVFESMKKFNSRLGDLLVCKLELNCSVLAEYLKIFRHHVFQQKRITLDEKELTSLGKIISNEISIAKLAKSIPTIQAFVQEGKAAVESYQTKDKVLDKTFKKELAGIVSLVQEVAQKLYKKRPKVTVRSLNQTTLLFEIAKSVISKEVPPIVKLNPEAVDYLKALDHLDSMVGVPNVVDENTYSIVCRHRRMKIENEIKLRCATITLGDSEFALTSFQGLLNEKKEKATQRQADLEKARNDKLGIVKDIEIQIVMKQGYVEIEREGNVDDFDDAVLICRNVVEDINRIIVQAGERKIKAMEETINFRREIRRVEWEHRKTKMVIEDLSERLRDIEGIKMTREVQNFLKARRRGLPVEKGLSLDQEVAVMNNAYQTIIDEAKVKIRDFQKQITKINKDSQFLDSEIEDFNVDVCEYNLQKDQELEEQERKVVDERFAMLRKRSNLIKQIQENHNEILVLQTELELLRLRTFPTLRYKIVT